MATSAHTTPAAGFQSPVAVSVSQLIDTYAVGMAAFALNRPDTDPHTVAAFEIVEGVQRLAAGLSANNAAEAAFQIACIVQELDGLEGNGPFPQEYHRKRVEMLLHSAFDALVATLPDDHPVQLAADLMNGTNLRMAPPAGTAD